MNKINKYLNISYSKKNLRKTGSKRQPEGNNTKHFKGATVKLKADFWQEQEPGDNRITSASLNC